MLRSRGIVAVIPEPGDQVGHRKRRGAHGGRPPNFNAEDYKGRNVVERAFNQLKNRRDWRPATTNTRSSTEADSFSPPSCSGSDDYRDTP